MPNRKVSDTLKIAGTPFLYGSGNDLRRGLSAQLPSADTGTVASKIVSGGEAHSSVDPGGGCALNQYLHLSEGMLHASRLPLPDYGLRALYFEQTL